MREILAELASMKEGIQQVATVGCASPMNPQSLNRRY